MGVLTIEAPRHLAAALASSAAKFGVEISQIFEDGDKIVCTLTGDGRKVLDASAFVGVKRTHWEGKTCLTDADRVQTVKRSRRQA